MIKIYIVRHGQTTWNKEHRLQGQQDSDLTEIGIEQAKALGAYLKKEGIVPDYIFSSPQKRAFDTAKYIADNKEIIIRENLSEIRFGTWEGRSLDEIKKENPIEFNHFFNETHLYNPSFNGGESFEEMRKRISEELSYLTSFEDKTLLIVGHGITLKILFAILNNHTLENFWKTEVLANSSLSLITFDNNKFNIEFISNTEFLTSEQTTTWNKK